MEPAGTASWKVLADAQAEAYKILMESFDGARVKPRAYISWQSDPLRRKYTETVGRDSGPEGQRQLTEARENVVYVGDGHMKQRSKCGSYRVRIRGLSGSAGKRRVESEQ